MSQVEKRSSLGAMIVGAVTVLGLVAIAALFWGWTVYMGPGPAAREGDATVVVLPSGSGVNAIGQKLRQAGVIRSTDMFRAAVSITGADRKLRAGEYEFDSKASLASVIATLKSGKVKRHFVTLPEGRSSAQAWDILMAEPLLTGEIEIPAEGSLLPETYEITRGESRASVIARMQEARDETLAALWAERAPNLVVRTPEEAMILASIVEKETGVPGERPLVAAVFTNRLRTGMRLQSDPTIVYPITKGRPLGRGIRRSELDAVTAYNTYHIDGLPPTPITNPGRESIRAVLNPPESDALFFVADGTGGHVFARTNAEHERNVARWRQIERQRAGLPPETVEAAQEPPLDTLPTTPAQSRAPITGQDIRPAQPAPR